VIPVLWRAQEQHGGWLPEPAIRYVADFLDMAYIRVYEVATFYTMFNLSPVGRNHVQLCGTTPCWLRGADELKEVCRRRIGEPGEVSEDGAFSWIEVECLGACVNAPMVQINADYYEDLDAAGLERILDALAKGKRAKPGSQIGRTSSEPLGGPTTLVNGKAPARKAAGGARSTGRKRSVRKPALLKAPRKGGADDLKRIDGIGPRLEELLNEIGVYHFRQIASWRPENVAWIEANLGFRGRTDWQAWIAEAGALARETG